jgi:hypothetical protein
VLKPPKRSRTGAAEPSPDGGDRALSNNEIVTLAVYLLGGDARYVDTEDVAVKANELAPGRFTWVKYHDQINIHTIKTHLWDAKSERKGALLLGSEKEGWMLAASGLELARGRVGALKGMKVARKKLSPAERQWRRGERVRMLHSDAFRKFTAEGSSSVTEEEADAFFRLNGYVVGEARERKITRVLNTFGDDEQLGPAVTALAARVRKG